jgi:ribosomal protein L14
MILKKTKLFLADNSGPKKIKCLKVNKKLIGYLSDVVTVIVKKKYLKRKKIKSNILKSLLINTKYKNNRQNGFFISFGKNKSLLLNNNNVFLGTNVKSVLCKEIKKYKKEYKKIISYSFGNV